MLGLCLEKNIFWQVGRQKNICILWIMHSWYTAARSLAGTGSFLGRQGAEMQRKR